MIASSRLESANLKLLYVFVLSLLVHCTHRHSVVFHHVLVADSSFVIHNSQPFEAVPAPEHSELITLTSYGK